MCIAENMVLKQMYMGAFCLPSFVEINIVVPITQRYLMLRTTSKKQASKAPILKRWAHTYSWGVPVL